MKRCLLVLVLVFFGWTKINAQSSVKDSIIKCVLVSPNVSFQIPGGDLAKRFGNNSTVGVSVGIKTAHNWLFSLEGNFLFGSKIKETTIFSGLTVDGGYIVGSDGLYADIRVYERGYTAFGNVGKIFPYKGPNPNCGILVQAGVGFLQHKIRIEDKKKTVPALRGDYLSGYDRLTNGIAAKQFVGYQYLGNKRLVNFFGGFEFIEGFTSGKRTYNFSSGIADNSKRFDLFMGIKVGWVMPFYKQAPEKFYTY
ncbi:MAG: hypothetical protein ACKOX3_11645 [Bacteroidota bacterium]